MKEYLSKNSSGNYQLVNHRFSEDDIEVPDGAEVFMTGFNTDRGCAFYKDGFNMVHGDNWKWESCRKIDISNHAKTAWQRHTQPEELPFMDSLPEFKHDFGASSLNDQYAEIEQVRQTGMKFDSNKPRHSLLPKGAVNSVIEVLEFGAKKYSADNWQEVENAKERYYNAAMRHIDLWWNGEKLDSETNVHHLAHAATNLFFLMWFDNK